MPRDPKAHPLDDRLRVQHMRNAAMDVEAMAFGRQRAELEADMLLRRAMLNAIQEIGEAATRVSQEGRARPPE